MFTGAFFSVLAYFSFWLQEVLHLHLQVTVNNICCIIFHIFVGEEICPNSSICEWFHSVPLVQCQSFCGWLPYNAFSTRASVRFHVLQICYDFSFQFLFYSFWIWRSIFINYQVDWSIHILRKSSSGTKCNGTKWNRDQLLQFFTINFRLHAGIQFCSAWKYFSIFRV